MNFSKVLFSILCVGVLFLTGCSTLAPYSDEAMLANGIKVNLGTKDNVHVNDKIALYEQRCTETLKRGTSCRLVEVGKLTVKEVFTTYSVVTPDNEYIFKEGQIFKFSNHCEDSEMKCATPAAKKTEG